MPVTKQQTEFPFAPEAREELLREAFEMGDVRWGSAAVQRNTVLLFRALLNCPSPATAELLIGRSKLRKTTCRSLITLHVGWGTISVKPEIGDRGRAVGHHAIVWERVMAWARGWRPNLLSEVEVRNPALSPESGRQVQVTAMEPGITTAGEQVPAANPVAATRGSPAALAEPPPCAVSPKDLDRSFTSVLDLRPRPRTFAVRTAADIRADRDEAWREKRGGGPQQAGALAAAAVTAAVKAMPDDDAQREKLLAELEAACGAEDWDDFAPDVALHIVELVKDGFHSRGDTGLPPKFWRRTLKTAKKGVTAYGDPIENRRRFLIGKFGKECQRRGLPWPFGRKGAQ